MQLRVDGVAASVASQEINLAGGGRISKAPAGDGIEIDFADDTVLTATPGFWPPAGKWYLNIHVARTRATEGIMGAIPPGSWLPALPNGASIGAMPATLHQRYVDLNQTFADAWRVSPATSLFDYEAGTSTATFTLRSWPPENPPCTLPDVPPVKPTDLGVAQQACATIGEKLKGDCVFDVMVTGETGFAKTYAIAQQLRAGATTTKVSDDRDPSLTGEPVAFTATVVATSSGITISPTGVIQFTIDGSAAGKPVMLNSKGFATLTTAGLRAGTHKVSARFIPAAGSPFLGSTSFDEPHVVRVRNPLEGMPMPDAVP
jgi:hypothetical protein